MLREEQQLACAAVNLAGLPDTGRGLMHAAFAVLRALLSCQWSDWCVFQQHTQPRKGPFLPVQAAHCSVSHAHRYCVGTHRLIFLHCCFLAPSWCRALEL